MQITITIPNDVGLKLIDRIANVYNYEPLIPNEGGDMIPNPITKIQFVKKCIKDFLYQVYEKGDLEERSHLLVASKALQEFKQVVVE